MGFEGRYSVEKTEERRDWVEAAAVSPEGRNWSCIASGDSNGELLAWQEETKAQSITAHSGSCICSLYLSLDGTALASGSEDKTMKPWSTETWQPQRDIITYGMLVNCVRYSPSGKFIAVATILGIQIYPSTGRSVHDPWIGHTDDITTIALNSNGTLVASASEDKHVRFWEIFNRQTIMISIPTERILAYPSSWHTQSQRR
ncbi:WD40 repeat-like protein [Rhizopogon salebrosus TDB-379]|nr:WD40 repeat-like protein [Rhizopogon salebrosus TDB-379]